MKIACYLSLYTQLYIRTLLPRKQGAASAKTKRWFVTNKHGDIVEANWRDESHQQGSLVLLPNALVFVHLLPQCSCFSIIYPSFGNQQSLLLGTNRYIKPHKPPLASFSMVPIFSSFSASFCMRLNLGQSSCSYVSKSHGFPRSYT